MSKKKRIIIGIAVGFMLIICFFIGGINIYSIYQENIKIEKILNEAKTNYEEKYIKQLESEIRNETDWEDLEIEIEYEVSDISTEDNYFIFSRLVFKSDEILNYLDIEKTSKEAKELIKIVRTIDDVCDSYEIDDKLVYTYKNKEEIKVKISNSYSLYGYDVSSKDGISTLEVDVYAGGTYIRYNGDYIALESSSDGYTETNYNSLDYTTITDKNELIEVWSMTKSFVKDKLKSPSSAEFPTYNDYSVSIKGAINYYKVTGYVYAENSFGAKTKATFSIFLKKNGSKYTLLECNIYE